MPAPNLIEALCGINPSCRACGLYHTQSPLLAPPSSSQVICVGLSAKQTKFPDEQPLDRRTNSGHIISLIEKTLGFTFYKTNLVKCAPVSNNRLRYPSKQEIQWCVPHLKGEIAEVNPKVVLMLGRPVAEGIAHSRGFTAPKPFHGTIHNGVQYIAIPHPSYIYIYRRKNIEQYVKTTAQLITQAITDAG